MVRDGYVEHKRVYDATRGEEERGSYGIVNPMFPSVILITHIFLPHALKGDIHPLLTYKPIIECVNVLSCSYGSMG